MSFTRLTGKRNVEVLPSAGTIAKGDAVQYNEAGEVIVVVTNVPVLGIALQDATSSTTVEVDILTSSDIVEATIETGTMGDAEVGNEADINSADGLTLTESNLDFIITGWDGVTTSKCYGKFRVLSR